MQSFNTLTLTVDKKGLATVTMNRPEVHNAFNAEMIAELTQCFRQLNADKSVRVILLQAAGKSFSAGADINWMKGMVSATQEENKKDSENLAALLRTINFCSKTTIAKVNGLAFGGGVGLICCCDMAVAEDNAKFGLTEAKLGLVAAVISPYVIDAIGMRKARRYLQTAEIFDASQAQAMGILSECVDSDDLDSKVDEIILALSSTGPNAKEISKKLVMSVVGRTLPQQKKIDEYTTQVIAAVRVSEEGQTGLKAFLDKQKPNWT
jgi:methylglutaconyl-CoA hydratase